MSKDIPDWAMRPATAEDREAIQRRRRRRDLQLTWPNMKALRAWAKQQGWPTPWFGFQEAIITKMLDNDDNFGLALGDSGIEMQVPIKSYILSAARIKEFDALYEEQSSFGQHVGWGPLVGRLREIRRAVEAGVRVEIEGTETVLRSWQGFYDWAHGRYHRLEDGYDSWIGDDKS